MTTDAKTWGGVYANWKFPSENFGFILVILLLKATDINPNANLSL